MYLTVDVGGTKTLLACFDDSGNTTEQIKFPTPPDYDDFLTALEENVHKLKVQDYARAAAAIPGRLDRDLGIAFAFGNLPWKNIPIQADIEKIFHCPTLIENDANLAGLSEAILVKDEFKKVLYVTVSTGIGTGIIINGIIDPNFVDTEGGQLLLEHNGRLLSWEDFASGRAIKAKYGKLVSEISDGDNLWYVIARNIAVGLVNLMAIIIPDVIIIGGGVGAHLEKFQDRLVEELKIYANPLVPTPVLRQAQRSEEAVIYGCYELIKQHASITT